MNACHVGRKEATLSDLAIQVITPLLSIGVTGKLPVQPFLVISYVTTFAFRSLAFSCCKRCQVLLEQQPMEDGLYTMWFAGELSDAQVLAEHGPIACTLTVSPVRLVGALRPLRAQRAPLPCQWAAGACPSVAAVAVSTFLSSSSHVASAWDGAGRIRAISP